MSKNHISLFNQYKCILIFQVYHSPGINAGENTEETDGITSKVKSLKKEWMWILQKIIAATYSSDFSVRFHDFWQLCKLDQFWKKNPVLVKISFLDSKINQT